MYMGPHQGSIVLKLAHTFIITKSFRTSREDSQIAVSPRHFLSIHGKTLTWLRILRAVPLIGKVKIRGPNSTMYHLSAANQTLVLNLDHACTTKLFSAQLLDSETGSLTVHKIIDSNEHAGSVG